MFKGRMGLSTRILEKIFTTEGRGADKRKLWIAAAADPTELHKIFFDPSTYSGDYNFQKIKKIFFLRFGLFSKT